MRTQPVLLTCWVATAVSATAFQASHFETPGGNRPAVRRNSGASILPGGRVVAPLGKQLTTGPGAFGLAVSPEGRIVTANLGPERLSLSFFELDKKGTWLIHHTLAARAERRPSDDEKELRSTFVGVVFADEKHIWMAEGNSGRVRLLDTTTGERRRLIDLNDGKFRDSFATDLALDAARGILYISDQANFRVVAVDTKHSRILSSVSIGILPSNIILSQDGNALYAANVGVFQYSPIPGGDANKGLTTGIAFPAFGFPSREAMEGVTRRTEMGEVKVPGLGDPNVKEANSIAIVDVADPSAMKVRDFVKTGRPFSPETAGGSSPSGVLAAAGAVYVSNAHDDTISVIDPKEAVVKSEIELRIPGLEKLRGIMPLGMAYDADSGWLLVAEAGINAVGIIDTKTNTVIGHVPVGWFPTRVALREGMVYAANAKGHGTGPNLPGREQYQDSNGLIDLLHRGSLSVFPLPAKAELEKHTATVMSANGFLPAPGPAGPIPPEIKYTVLIVKENRTYDEVFGDLGTVANGGTAGIPALARLGTAGYADGGGSRLSLQRTNVTPNHHSMAKQWAFSDNFYSDSEVSVDGHHWLVGNYPDAWTESSLMAAYAGQKDFRFPTTAPGRLIFAGTDSSVHPEEIEEAGTIWHQLERYQIPFRNFGEGFELAGVQEEPGEKPTGARFLTNVPMPDPLYRNTSRIYPGFNMNIPDQYRAAQFIADIEENFVKPGKELPRFIFIHLPNDHMTKPRPEDGYPYAASYVADNDLALGKIVEYLSHSPWWKQMAIFITEDDAQGGRDHIDAHRTVLLGVGPYFKKNYAVHINSSFPGLLKTIFRILGVPPLNLYDACAADLSDAFTTEPDFSTYTPLRPDVRLFDAAKAREPKDPKPSERMDAR